MNVFHSILAIAILWVFILDLSGIVEAINGAVTRHLPKPYAFRLPRPFSCSKCMTWWTGLALLICMGCVEPWTYVFLAGIAYLTPQILYAFRMVASWIDFIIDRMTI